ncbi:GNAT family N-acetyltransferase [Paenibacillus sp. FSL H3-0333]|uniref:GNAT family N-acetyltransferase n=1 Tax=Paenibacillus sp. FSL H3-0333 TaxID=2921373 RepID=UPI0030F668BE
MSIQAVLFDFDGTLADTLPLSFRAFQAVFKQYDQREVTRDELVAMFGPTEEGIIGGNFTDPASVPQAIEDYYSIYKQGHFEEFQNNEHILGLLQALKAQGMKLGVITGKSRRAYQISAGALDLEHFFDLSITGDDVAKPKPDPEGIHSALRTLGIEPSQAIFVGDSNADILAGKAAGMQTYAVRWLPTFQSQAYDLAPDGILENVAEFQRLLQLNNIIPMTYHSKQQAADIKALEQQCSQADSIQLSSDLEHLVKEDGDHALLCYREDQLIGLLSWFAADSDYAQINAMVHPDYRRQGVFRSLVKCARADIEPLGVHRLSYKIPASSQTGLLAAQALGGDFDRSEYAMSYAGMNSASPLPSELILLPAAPEDLEFMVSCSSQAFGESEDDTRKYFTQTDEPERITYIAWTGSERIGLIRVNYINENTAFIHNFCILPSHQGKGVGEKVLRQAVGILLQKPYPVIRLSVVTGNVRALNLYLRAGFKIHSEYKYYSGSLYLEP